MRDREEPLEAQVNKAPQVNEDHKEIVEFREMMDHQVLPEIEVQPVILDHLEMMEFL